MTAVHLDHCGRGLSHVASRQVTEHKLGNHAPGTLLQPSVKVTSSAVAAGRRTVTLTRSVK